MGKLGGGRAPAFFVHGGLLLLNEWNDVLNDFVLVVVQQSQVYVLW